MTEPLPMRELARLQSLQIKVGQMLVKSKLDPALRSDLEKLFAALEHNVNKLDDLQLKGISLDSVDDPTLRHDMRNAIGISRGYAELIRETAEAPTASLSNLLDKVILWSNKSLNSLENTRRKKAASTATTSTLNSAEPGSYSGNILILDDQPANRDLLSRYIEQLGLKAYACATAAEAFKILQQQNIDLILLDLVMPEMSGHEVLAKLKASRIWRAIPVIVISGLADQAEVIRCIEAGAEDYLQKPFNRVLLQARLAAGLDRKRWVDTERRLSEELEKSHRFIKNTFGRYLSSEIVSNLLDRPDGLDMGGQLQTVTILMADIRGFTTISEQLSPQSVVKLLNNYLGSMADIIMAHGGIVDEFIGDAILALFGAPVTSEHDRANAVRCALAMQRAMDDVNQRNIEQGLPRIEMGIGLNTGEVVAGNIGSSTRAKYGVVGHAVNVTSRIEDQTGPGEILAAESTLRDSELQLTTGRQLDLQPKGVSERVHVSQVIDAVLPPSKNAGRDADAAALLDDQPQGNRPTAARDQTRAKRKTATASAGQRKNKATRANTSKAPNDPRNNTGTEA
ncbi:MAG: response regulator [Pseudomonadales bacterium]|nr:response regulator [Pseudomonadales bacterium]